MRPANKEPLSSGGFSLPRTGSFGCYQQFPVYYIRFGQDDVKIAARLFALNYLLQKRQGGPSRTKGRSRVSYRVERIEDSREAKHHFISPPSRLLQSTFAERNSARCNFYGKTRRLRYSRYNVVVINEIFASGCLDINSVITLRNGDTGVSAKFACPPLSDRYVNTR